MVRALLINDQGDQYTFQIPHTFVDLEYRGRRWTLQPKATAELATYREVSIGYRVTDADRV